MKLWRQPLQASSIPSTHIDHENSSTIRNNIIPTRTTQQLVKDVENDISTIHELEDATNHLHTKTRTESEPLPMYACLKVQEPKNLQINPHTTLKYDVQIQGSQSPYEAPPIVPGPAWVEWQPDTLCGTLPRASSPHDDVSENHTNDTIRRMTLVRKTLGKNCGAASSYRLSTSSSVENFITTCCNQERFRQINILTGLLRTINLRGSEIGKINLCLKHIWKQHFNKHTCCSFIAWKRCRSLSTRHS